MTHYDWLNIVGPALVAGFAIALMHVPLGLEVLKRGIVFIDLAVAQVVGLGLAVAIVFFENTHATTIQLVVLPSAIGAGLFFNKLETLLPSRQEAIIGVVYVLAASLSILVLANHPHGDEEIKAVLSGQILFVDWKSSLGLIVFYTLLLFIWTLKPSWQRGVGFYIFFSFAVTPAVQFVGVFVVFASLILPALASEWVRTKQKKLTAWVISVVSLLLGLVFSVWFDLPSGPLIVLSYCVVTVLFIGRFLFISKIL